jgi:5-methylthioribose kinase
MNNNDAIWLLSDSVDAVSNVLREVGWLSAAEELDGIERAGEGNMNCTLRAKSGNRSVIVKQSRPWVEKYPQIAAPVERAQMEIRFYRTIQAFPSIAERMPRLLNALPDRYLLVLEDLAPAMEGWAAYDDRAARTRVQAALPVLIAWLAELHRVTEELPNQTEFANLPLRSLNHDHVFQIPFTDPPAVDLDALTPGLERIARQVRSDGLLRERCVQLGDLYLAPGPCLVHGDFFPGSWMFSERGAFVIDPEFCYFGKPEWDLAIIAAHLRILASDEPDEHASEDWEAMVVAEYELHDRRVEIELVRQWAAVEVLRRLIGVAQLPLTRSLDQKNRLIQHAVATVT